MTGRAKGLSRGRGRKTQQEARRPGEESGRPHGASPPAQTGAHPPAQTGAHPPAQTGAHPPTPQAPPQVAPSESGAGAAPTQAMAQMSVAEGRGRRQLNRYEEVECRPQWCVDKRGSSGTRIQLVSNYFRMTMVVGRYQNKIFCWFLITSVFQEYVKFPSTDSSIELLICLY